MFFKLIYVQRFTVTLQQHKYINTVKFRVTCDHVKLWNVIRKDILVIWHVEYNYQLTSLRTCEIGFHICSLRIYLQLHVYHIYCLRLLSGTQVATAVQWTEEHKQHEKTCDISDGLHHYWIAAGKLQSFQLLVIFTVYWHVQFHIHNWSAISNRHVSHLWSAMVLLQIAGN
jgi:hypothetical protein